MQKEEMTDNTVGVLQEETEIHQYHSTGFEKTPHHQILQKISNEK